jgi:hypothetical protein
MSYELARRILETAFLEEMPVGSAIQFGNTTFQAPAGGFTRINIIEGGGSSLLSIGGTRARRYAGIIDVAIFVPRDVGTAGLRTVAARVEDALANRAFEESSTTITTFGAGFTDIGASGDWHQGNVTVNYQRDTVAALEGSLRLISGNRLYAIDGTPLSFIT